MPRIHPFGAVLARIRREQGFPTAHAFYRARDGRRALKITFRNYLNLENGRSLPKSGRLEAILTALGLREHAAQARELVRAYFTSLGLEPLLRFASLSAPGAAAASGSRLGALAVKQATKGRTIQLAVEQWKLLSDDYEAHRLHTLLGNTSGWLTMADISRSSGLKTLEVRRALKALARAGLARVSGEKAQSALAGLYWEAPPLLPELVGVNSALRRHVEKWTARAAQPIIIPPVTARLKTSHVQEYARHLEEAVNLAAAFGDDEPSAESAVYMGRAQLFRVFP
jgi:hypothetical protein